MGLSQFFFSSVLPNRRSSKSGIVSSRTGKAPQSHSGCTGERADLLFWKWAKPSHQSRPVRKSIFNCRVYKISCLQLQRSSIHARNAFGLISHSTRKIGFPYRRNSRNRCQSFPDAVRTSCWHRMDCKPVTGSGHYRTAPRTGQTVNIWSFRLRMSTHPAQPSRSNHRPQSARCWAWDSPWQRWQSEAMPNCRRRTSSIPCLLFLCDSFVL